MKAYEIKDSRTGIGILLYFEKSKTFIIELRDDLDEWTAPLLFSGPVKKKIFTMPRDISKAWVEERIIPCDRQNINDILTNHHLKEYDALRLLELSQGRCAQDDLIVRKIDNLPDYVTDRMERNVVDVVVMDENRGLCFFADDTVRIVELKVLDGFDRIKNNAGLLESGRVGCGGYYVTFNDSIDYPASVFYEKGRLIPLTRDDFITFMSKNVLDTTQSCRLLNCSRQNLSYLVRQGSIQAAKPDVNGNLYLKGDVIKNTW